jgi:hypothetical protein
MSPIIVGDGTTKGKAQETWPQAQGCRGDRPWQNSCFFAVLGLELRMYTLSHSISPFCDGFFWDGVSPTILPRLASSHDPPDLCLWVTVKEGPCAGSGEGGQRSETWSRKVHKRLLLFCFYWSIDWIISEEKACIWEVCVWPVHRCKRKGRAPWHPPSAWGRDRRAASLEPKALWGGSCVITAIYQDSSPQGFGCFPFIQLVYLGGNWCQ